MTKQERAEMYRSFLASEGYTPKIDNDGDVAFKFEGGNYYILVDDKDEAFFRLAYPGFWEIESEEERAKVIEAALHATAQTKQVFRDTRGRRLGCSVPSGGVRRPR